MKEIYKCKLHKRAASDGISAARIVENKCSGYSELEEGTNKTCKSCRNFVGNRS